MTKQELIEELKRIIGYKDEPKHMPVAYDRAANHSEADALLIQYIDDPEVEALYDQIDKWYA